MNKNKIAGARLKALREEKNVKQEIIADQLGVSQSKISKIENGVIEITISILAAYYFKLNISPHDLLDVLEPLG